MKYTTTWKKNSFLLLFLILFSFTLAAEDIKFFCNKKDIPEKAKGLYNCDYTGKIYYATTSGEELDLFSLTPPDIPNKNLVTDELRIYTASYQAYGNNFYSFDESGNLYFLATASFYVDLMRTSVADNKIIDRAVFLYCFNPTEKTISNLLITKESIPHSFCLSDDGKWAFIDTLDLVNIYDKKGYSSVYSLPTDFSFQPQIVYKSSVITNDTSLIRNICFDSNVHKAYFYNENDRLYFISADEEGNYVDLSSFSMKKYSTPTPACAVYSNKDGLWGIKQSKNDTNSSQLFQITDAYGNLFDPNHNVINKEITGNWKTALKISVQPEFILFVSKNNSKIYKYENASLNEVSNLLPHKKVYTNTDLEILSETLLNTTTETSLEGYKTKLKILLCICCIIFAVLIVLIIWIIYLSKKSNLIKKDKQFIFNIQENERGKISRDIHDSIIQDIRAIRIETELLNVDAESETRKNKVIDLATDCVVKLRNICYNLTPAELATHNDGDSSKIELVSIIQSLVLQFIERTHMPCQLKIDENFDYPVLEKETSQNLFRIIQEALNNIEKHSYATSCQILIKNRIEDDKNRMLIYISDDGVGCDLKQLTKRKTRNHFGIRNMQDRADLIGASIEFRSEPGQGLEVKITV